MAQKRQNLPILIFRQLQRKCIFYVIFLQKYLVNSKNCRTFASAFAQKWGSPQEPKQMIFEKMSIHNKIVVQELKK